MCKYSRFFFVLFLFFNQAGASAQTASNHFRLADVKSPESAAAVAQFIADAELAMGFRAFPVTDNTPIRSGKTRNEYYSWAPYLWPNPATKDGFPYINRDGKTNPETEAKSDKPLLRRMAVSAHTLVLACHYSKDEKYAKKAASMIKT